MDAHHIVWLKSHETTLKYLKPLVFKLSQDNPQVLQDAYLDPISTFSFEFAVHVIIFESNILYNGESNKDKISANVT